MSSSCCFGDGVSPEDGRSWCFRANGGKAGMVLRLVTDKGTAAEAPFSLKGTAQLEAKEKGWKFAYLTAGYPIGKTLFVRAISNPVYFDAL